MYTTVVDVSQRAVHKTALSLLEKKGLRFNTQPLRRILPPQGNGMCGVVKLVNEPSGS